MDNWYLSPVSITTIVLMLILLVAAALILIEKVNKYLDRMQQKTDEKKKLAFSEELINLEEPEVDQLLQERRQALNFRLSGEELGSTKRTSDHRGLVNKLSTDPERPFFSEKKGVPADRKSTRLNSSH